MAEEYNNDPSDFHLFTVDEYVNLVIDFMERLRSDIIVERFASQSPASLLATKGWGLKNFELVEIIKKRMRERHTPGKTVTIKRPACQFRPIISEYYPTSCLLKKCNFVLNNHLLFPKNRDLL